MMQLSPRLKKNGRPAAKEMLRNVAESDEPSVMTRSVYVLLEIHGGGHRLLQVLERMEREAQDSAVALRIRRAHYFVIRLRPKAGYKEPLF